MWWINSDVKTKFREEEVYISYLVRSNAHLPANKWIEQTKPDTLDLFISWLIETNKVKIIIVYLVNDDLNLVQTTREVRAHR